MLPSTGKQVEQQNSEFNSLEIFEPGTKENRQQGVIYVKICNDLLPTATTLLK